MSASCTSAGIRVISSIRTTCPARIAVITGDATSAASRRAFGDQPRVVPAVPDRVLGGPGRALHEQRRVAADRGREMLRQPGLAVPGRPSSSRARSVASVATATSTSRRDPTYFGVMTVPSGSAPPSR